MSDKKTIEKFYKMNLKYVKPNYAYEYSELRWKIIAAKEISPNEMYNLDVYKVLLNSSINPMINDYKNGEYLCINDDEGILNILISDNDDTDYKVHTSFGSFDNSLPITVTNAAVTLKSNVNDEYEAYIIVKIDENTNKIYDFNLKDLYLSLNFYLSLTKADELIEDYKRKLCEVNKNA